MTGASTSPPSRRYRSAALLFLGFVCGLSMTVVICGLRVERVTVENQHLAMALAEAKRDLARLGASLTEARHPVIEEIGLEIRGVANDSAEIRGVFRRKLEILIGKEPAALDPEVVAETISGVVMIEDRTYQAAPDLLVLACKSFFRINITMVSKKESDID